MGMPTLHNAKHEHFAQLLAKGEAPQKAYVLAGYSEQGAAQSASRLLRNAKICSRVAQLRDVVIERAIEKTGIDKAWIMERLVENATLAAAAEDYSPSNKALELLGKELGMFAEKQGPQQPGPSVAIQINVNDPAEAVRSYRKMIEGG